MTHLSLLIRGTAFGAILLGACALCCAQGPHGAGAAVPTRSTVVSGKAVETIPISRKKYVGNVEAIEEVDSVARVSGFLKVAEGFEEGSHVEKGQLLFEIDPTPYQAKVDAAKANINQIQARISYALSNYNRASSLLEKQAGSKNDEENALSALQSLRAELDSAKAQLVLAEEDLSYTKIHSMITGRVGRRNYSTGSYVTPTSQPLARVVQMDPIYVRFTMSERDYMSMFGDVASLKENAALELTLPNDSKYPVQGKVGFVNNNVKSTTDTIKIWATFENPNEVLYPGGVVTVNLARKLDQKVAGVEPSAVMFDGKKNYVYILVDEINDEDLFNELSKDNRFRDDLERIENGALTKEDFIKTFKESHYVWQDPKTGEDHIDFADGKVTDPKLKMVLRREVVLGPSDGGIETIFNGVEVGQEIIMDGVNKARPFDLVRPVPRSAGEELKAPVAPKKEPVGLSGTDESEEETSEEVEESDAEEKTPDQANNSVVKTVAGGRDA